MMDFHTHNLDADDALICVEPGFTPRCGAMYSVGIHPWHAGSATDEIIARLRYDARRECVRAIGETGIDRLHADTLPRQIELTRLHVALSEELRKPLVLHVVKAYSEIIALKRELRPTQPWVIHGFRGKPELARQLLRADFYLSLGAQFNRDAAAVIPAERLLVETDDSSMPISEIASRLPQYTSATAIQLLHTDRKE
jgi:TatD DNase family protein